MQILKIVFVAAINIIFIQQIWQNMCNMAKQVRNMANYGSYNKLK